MHDQVEDPLLVLDACRLADRVHGHTDGDRLVHSDFLEIDVHQRLRDRVELDVPDDRDAGLAVSVEFERQELGAALAAVDDPQELARIHGDR